MTVVPNHLLLKFEGFLNSSLILGQWLFDVAVSFGIETQALIFITIRRPTRRLQTSLRRSLINICRMLLLQAGYTGSCSSYTPLSIRKVMIENYRCFQRVGTFRNWRIIWTGDLLESFGRDAWTISPFYSHLFDSFNLKCKSKIIFAGSIKELCSVLLLELPIIEYWLKRRYSAVLYNLSTPTLSLGQAAWFEFEILKCYATLKLWAWCCSTVVFCYPWPWWDTLHRERLYFGTLHEQSYDRTLIDLPYIHVLRDQDRWPRWWIPHYLLLQGNSLLLILRRL